MAKDPAMPGPVSALEGGSYPSSEEVRAEDAGENIPDETGEGLTRSEIINVFGEAFGRALLDAGYASFTSLRMASDEELLAISGVGPAKVERIREAVGRQEAPEDEQEIPELGPLASGAPAPPERRGRGGQVVDGETALDTSARFGEDVPDFGTEGSVSPRVARIRAAAAKMAEVSASAREAQTLAEIEAAGGVVELEAEIEVEENPSDYEPGPDVVGGEGGSPLAADGEVEPETDDLAEVVDAEIEDDPTGQVEETLEEIEAEAEGEVEPEPEPEEAPEEEEAPSE